MSASKLYTRGIDIILRYQYNSKYYYNYKMFYNVVKECLKKRIEENLLLIDEDIDKLNSFLDSIKDDVRVNKGVKEKIFLYANELIALSTNPTTRTRVRNRKAQLKELLIYQKELTKFDTAYMFFCKDINYCLAQMIAKGKLLDETEIKKLNEFSESICTDSRVDDSLKREILDKIAILVKLYKKYIEDDIHIPTGDNIKLKAIDFYELLTWQNSDGYCYYDHQKSYYEHICSRATKMYDNILSGEKVLDENKIEKLNKFLNNTRKSTLISEELKNNIIDVITNLKTYSEKVNEQSSFERIKQVIDECELKEIIYYQKNTLNKDKYGDFFTYFNKYLRNRMTDRDWLNEEEIELLSEYCSSIKSNMASNLISLTLILSFDLITISKERDDDSFVEKISEGKRKSLDGEELYKYLKYMASNNNRFLPYKYVSSVLFNLPYDLELLNKTNKLFTTKRLKRLIERKISRIELYNSLTKDNEYESIRDYNYPSTNLNTVEGRKIVTIDDSCSPDLDGAFSIKKHDDLYFFDVYITDVPSFLLENEKLISYAYDRTQSFYFGDRGSSLLTIDMLPTYLSHDKLSLKKNNNRNVIKFSYCIDKHGNVNLESISRNMAYIDDNIDPKGLQLSTVDPDMKEFFNDYNKMCNLVCKNTGYKFLKRLTDENCAYKWQAFPSILTNYIIGENANLSIYRKKGMYVKESEDKYTQSVTPLRRFVSDINLTLYLNQLGIIDCPDKYIYYVEDNLDAIINHLNENEIKIEAYQKQLSDFRNINKKNA